MKRVNVNVDLMQVFVIIYNIGIMINAGVNAKNWLTMVVPIRDLSGISVIVSVNAINHVMLVSKIVSAEKN